MKKVDWWPVYRTALAAATSETREIVETLEWVMAEFESGEPFGAFFLLSTLAAAEPER
ncbi:MAG: hypothetical protein U1E63_07285 [Burkholderiales bacterium]